MTDKLIPESASLAAKRGFLRTASQSLATGFGVPGALTLILTGDGLLALLVGLAGLVFNALVNGAQSYFSLLSSGIPQDYKPEAAILTDAEGDREEVYFPLHRK